MSRAVVYRIDKVGHVAGLALVGTAFGAPVMGALVVSGLLYWLGSVALVLKAKKPLRVDDKARDLLLAAIPALVWWHPVPGVLAFVMAIHLPIKN